MQDLEVIIMPGESHSDIVVSGILVATPSAELIKVVQESLVGSGLAVRGAAGEEEAATAMLAPLSLSAALLDVELGKTALEGLLAAMRTGGEGRRFPIVLVCDEDLLSWRDYLYQGVIDDLVPRTMQTCQWGVRLEVVQRSFRRLQECEQLRQRALMTDSGTDPVTGLCTREGFLSMLFRETDRVQRMKTSLSIMMFEIDAFAAWQQRLGTWACEGLLKQVVSRLQRLLRTYDGIGRMGRSAFALCLPGCATVDAAALAERMRAEVFSPPFLAGSSAIHLTARCGIAASHGRSPLVVLRDAGEALASAAPRDRFTPERCGSSPFSGQFVYIEAMR
jgi:diguanylate cyclase (GGDEF)-like protein